MVAVLGNTFGGAILSQAPESMVAVVMSLLTVTPFLTRSPGKSENFDLNLNLGPLILFILFLQFSFLPGGLTSLKSAPQNPYGLWGGRLLLYLGSSELGCTAVRASTLACRMACMGLSGATAPQARA